MLSSSYRKNWRVKNERTDLPVIDKLLQNRGLTDQDQIETFLKTSLKKGLHNPFLMKGMDKAVARIKRAIADNERIMIFGDYDVDGVSGTAIIFHILKQLNARVSYRLPHRVEHGYGMSNDFINEFIGLGVNLIITVDTGISCKEQVDLAAEKGIDTIITDHHTIPENFPDRAFAVLHPSQPDCEYPFKGLTGAGVAYKLASALITDHYGGEDRGNNIFDFLDLASLGTVADLGPLVGENRIIVKYGLEALKNTKWYGLDFLKKHAGIDEDTKIDVNVIGYRLGPRINAAGRIDSPYYALQLLLHDKLDDKAMLLAQHLENLNQKRQQMVIEALDGISRHHASEIKDKKIFIAWDKDWHAGILGLLASRCVEKYSVPTIIMQDLGDVLVASGRSPGYFNMVEALTTHGDLLKSFGGHVQAAGFTIDKKNADEFKAKMEKYAEEMLKDHEPVSVIDIDCELPEDEIDERLLRFMDQMEPFGVGNEQPVFVMRNLRPQNIRRVGKEANHIHFEVLGKLKRYPVIGFKLGHLETYLQEQGAIDLACYLEQNEWKGITKLQLRAVDLKAAEEE